MPRATVFAIDQRVAQGRAHRRRRALEKKMEKEPAGAPRAAAAFDREGYAAFLKSWADILDEMPEVERERLTARAVVYFRGAPMDGGWRALVRYLSEARRSARTLHATTPQRDFLDYRNSMNGSGW